jgi:hypothetical protein
MDARRATVDPADVLDRTSRSPTGRNEATCPGSAVVEASGIMRIYSRRLRLDKRADAGIPHVDGAGAVLLSRNAALRPETDSGGPRNRSLSIARKRSRPGRSDTREKPAPSAGLAGVSGLRGQHGVHAALRSFVAGSMKLFRQS